LWKSRYGTSALHGRATAAATGPTSGCRCRRSRRGRRRGSLCNRDVALLALPVYSLRQCVRGLLFRAREDDWQLQ
jgi:hypothetical protein